MEGAVVRTPGGGVIVAVGGRPLVAVNGGPTAPDVRTWASAEREQAWRLPAVVRTTEATRDTGWVLAPVIRTWAAPVSERVLRGTHADELVEV